MTNLLSTIRQVALEQRRNEAEKMDRKMTRRALRLNPQAEFLVVQVSGGRDMQSLVSQGWTVVAATNLAPMGGTSLSTRFTLQKINPNTLAELP